MWSCLATYSDRSQCSLSGDHAGGDGGLLLVGVSVGEYASELSGLSGDSGLAAGLTGLGSLRWPKSGGGGLGGGTRLDSCISPGGGGSGLEACSISPGGGGSGLEACSISSGGGGGGGKSNLLCTEIEREEKKSSTLCVRSTGFSSGCVTCNALKDTLP